MFNERIGVQIVTSRRDYLGVLLSSLLRQTYSKWDVFLIYQDPNIINDNMTNHILNRISWEGHRIKLIQSEEGGIGNLRNKALNADDCKYGVRIDDDSWCEPDYFERLIYVLKKEENVGCVGGLVPFMSQEKIYRPFENLGWINEFGDMDETFPVNFYNVMPKTYVPVRHLRSSFAYINDRAREVMFPTEYDEYAGFREETDFSLRMGEKWENFFVPQAVCWHLHSPSGGTRPLWEKHGMGARQKAETLFRRKFYGKL